ncbi:MAG: DUF3466 family protein [Verrucomicrobiota bacterium]
MSARDPRATISTVAGVYRAFRNQGGAVPIEQTDDLGNLCGFACFNHGSEARDINDLDEIVGSAQQHTTAQWHAFFKLATAPAYQMMDLGVLAGGNKSIALGINNKGHVVGNSRTTGTGGERAFICYNNFNGTSSVMVNLNNVLDASGAGWVLQSAEAINDQNWIVGYGTKNGQTRAFRLTPNY